MAAVLSAIVGIGVAGLLWKPFFGDIDEFFDCIKYWFKPDILSFFDGEGWEDRWAELKLGVWIGLSVAAGIAAFSALQ